MASEYIGRDRTPAERTLAHARNNPETAEHYGRNIYEARTKGDWLRLSAEDRATWVERAITELEQHVGATGDRPPPDPPDGGQGARVA